MSPNEFGEVPIWLDEISATVFKTNGRPVTPGDQKLDKNNYRL